MLHIDWINDSMLNSTNQYIPIMKASNSELVSEENKDRQMNREEKENLKL